MLKKTMMMTLRRQKVISPKLTNLKYHGPFQDHNILQKELTNELFFKLIEVLLNEISCLFCQISLIFLTLKCHNLSLNFIFHFILINLNLSFGIFEVLFLVSNVNIRHFSKIRQICQASYVLFEKTS